MVRPQPGRAAPPLGGARRRPLARRARDELRTGAGRGRGAARRVRRRTPSRTRRRAAAGSSARSSSTTRSAPPRAGSTMALGFTNPMAGPILVGKLGWDDLYRLRLWARPLRLRRTGAGGLAPRSARLPRVVRRPHEALWRREGYGNASCAAPSTSPGATWTRRATTGCSATSAASRWSATRCGRASRPASSASSSARRTGSCAAACASRRAATSCSASRARGSAAPTSRPASCPRPARSA